MTRIYHYLLSTIVCFTSMRSISYAQTQEVLMHTKSSYARDVTCEDILKIGFLDPTKPIEDDKNIAQIVYNALYHLPKDVNVATEIDLDGILRKLASISVDSKVEISKESIKGNIKILEALLRAHQDVRLKIIDAISENNKQIIGVWSDCQKRLNSRQVPTTLTWVDWTKNDGKSALALSLIVDKPREGYQYCAEIIPQNAKLAATISPDSVCKSKGIGIGLGNSRDSNTLLFSRARKDSPIVFQISVSERSVSRDNFSPVPDLRRTLVLPAMINETSDLSQDLKVKSLEYSPASPKNSKEQVYSINTLKKPIKVAMRSLSVGWNLAVAPKYENGIFPYSSQILKHANGVFEVFSLNPIGFDISTNQLRFTLLAQNNYYVACEEDSSGGMRLAASSKYPHTLSVPSGMSASPIVFVAEPANIANGRVVRIRSSLYPAGAVRVRDYVAASRVGTRELNPGYYPPLDCNSNLATDSSATFEFQVIED